MSVIFVYIYVDYFYFNFSLYNFYRGDDVKKLFIDFSIDLIKKNCNYSEEQIEVIVYGLEGIYLTITKMIVLVSLAYILGILKEFFLILILSRKSLISAKLLTMANVLMKFLFFRFLHLTVIRVKMLLRFSVMAGLMLSGIF